MKTIQREAKRFTEDLFNDGYVFKIEKAKHILNSKIDIIYKLQDQLEFLRLVRNEITTMISNHKLTCQKDDCQFIREKEDGLYLIDQEIDRINSNYSPEIKNHDKFTPEEEAEYQSRLDRILEKLEKLGHGQEVLYEEIDSLKNHFNIGKKNWKQLFAAKIISVGVEKGLEELVFENPIKYLAEKIERVV